MRARSEIHDAFVARFHFGGRNIPFTDQQLNEVERLLDTILPASYRTFVRCHGVVHTPSILNGIVNSGLSHTDIQVFLEPTAVIDDTQLYWSGGMPDHVIGFASDCMGNMIGFHRQHSHSDDAPVIFFDHDFVEVHQIATSFDEYLAWFLDHL